MNLHENPDVFEELILATASELRIPTSVVEKRLFCDDCTKVVNFKNRKYCF